MKISLGLFFSLILLTAERISEVEYKGMQKPISILVKKFSPAFAALEDTFEIKSNSDEIIKDFQSHLINIKSGQPEIKIVKLDGFKVQRPNSESVVNMTRKVASSAKNIFERSFDFTSTKIQDQKTVALNLNTPSNNKHIDIDGVGFEIGVPNDVMPVLNNPQIPQDLLSSVVKGITNTETQSMGPISISPSSISNSMGGGLNPFNEIHPKNISKRTIQGQIELAGGAVYPGERFQFYVQRVFDGVVQERGEINSWTGEFNISIKEPKGWINVELRHDSGALIALGQLALNSQTPLNKTLLVKVLPSENAHYIGQVLSYESFEEFEVAVEKPTEVYIEGDQDTVMSDAKGRIANHQPLAAGSQILVSASHKGYWNSLQIAEAGQPLKTIMHSDKHMKSFLKLIEPYLESADIHSVIWGRVTDQGRAMGNVKVSLHGFEDIQPLYFSFRIPDPNLESTSSDGFFAFINPPEGLHIVKTDQSNMPLESVVVRMDHTSIATLATAPKKLVQLYSYDAFNNDLNVPAKISIPGMPSSWKVGREIKPSQVQFFDTPTNMVMDVEPLNSEFLPTRYFIGRRRAAVNIPQFRRAWVESLLASQRVNQIPKTSNLMGWVEKGSYTVDVYPKDENTRVIYFDKNGAAADSLHDGGGFIIANVQLGVVATTLRESQTGKVVKRLSLVEPHQLSVNYIQQLDY